MLEEIHKVILMTIMPSVEARAAVAYVVIFLENKSPLIPLLLSLPTIMVGLIVYRLLDFLEREIVSGFLSKISFVRKVYFKYIIHVRNKSRKYVEKYGQIGLILFIAIPLPGSGAWTGALVAKIFNIDFAKTVISIVVGVILSSYISYIASMLGISLVKLII